ncbi:MAG: type II toxin-antitoxin system RelE/ParE family toxin [Burkholderiales bacterium]
MTIQSFLCANTESLYHGKPVTRWTNIERGALQGDRKGQHSIRINDQWRVCFVWADDGAHDVELVDYH